MTDSGPATTTRVDLAINRLRELIDKHRLSGTTRLPRETELSQQLGISRNTLREALSQLASEGVIVRRRRLGTFIAEAPQDPVGTQSPLNYPIDEIVTLPAFFGSTPAEFSIQSVSVVTESAAAADARLLGVAPGTAVYRIRRVFALDGVGAAIGEHVLPTIMKGHGVHIEALTDGISTFLKDVENIDVDVVEHLATATSADPETARDLLLPAGAPVLAVDAKLCNRADGTLDVVAIGRLTFNPRLVRVRAAGELHG